MNGTSGLLLVVLVALLIWGMSDGRSPIYIGHRTSVQAAGDDLKSMGRDTASAIRRTVQ